MVNRKIKQSETRRKRAALARGGINDIRNRVTKKERIENTEEKGQGTAKKRAAIRSLLFLRRILPGKNVTLHVYKHVTYFFCT